MTDQIYISNEYKDKTEDSILIKGYDHTNIPQEANLVFGVSRIWENDWQNYGQGMLINGIEEAFSEKGIDSKDEDVTNLLTMSNRIRELNKMPFILEEELQLLEKINAVQIELNNIKIEIYNELYPEIVEEEKKEVLKEWFDPDSDRKDGESYWGRFTIQSVQNLIDLRNPSEETVKMVTAQIQKLFPKGVYVRICIKEPTYETDAKGNNWNSYSKEERTFPVFISYNL